MKKEQFRSVLIFGGAGFIGSNWAGHLLQNTDAKVHIYDNLSRSGVRNNLEWLQTLAGNSSRLQITVGDIRDASKVERVVRHATEVYHFAAQVAVTASIEDPRLDFEINVGGTLNILEAVRKARHRPFVLFTSTNKVYGDLGMRELELTNARYRFRDIEGISELQPLDFHSPYGCSKGAADQYVRDYARIYGIPAVVLRMSCIAGPRQFGNEDQGWIAHFLISAITGQPLVIYGDGCQVRDVLCVQDLLSAFEAIRAGLAVTEGQIYNIGGGPGNTTSLLELLVELEKLTGRKVQHRFAPRRAGDQLVYVTDFTRLRRDTGWEPQFTLRQTLERMQDWLRRYRDLFAVAAPVAEQETVASTVLQQVPGAAA